MTEPQHPKNPDPDDPEQWAWLARLRRPQGRKGEVFADILTDFPEKFAERKKLWLLADHDAQPHVAKAGASGSAVPGKRASAARQAELVNHWPHKGGIVLHFAHSQSISDAEQLSGLIVAIPREQRAALADDEVYIADLIGCTLVDLSSGDPVAVGAIVEVDRSAGPVALLVVQPPHGQNEILVPFAKSYLRNIDLAAQRVEMALPQGLLDLNAS
jgi:16S rRNA processing protein RimM